MAPWTLPSPSSIRDGGAVNTVAVQGGGFNGALAGTSDKLLVGGFNLRAASSDNWPRLPIGSLKL